MSGVTSKRVAGSGTVFPVLLVAILAAGAAALFAGSLPDNELRPLAFVLSACAMATALAFVFGACCSGIAGVLGMWVAIRTNVRVAMAARDSTASALRVALRGGAVAGLVVPAMSLAGVATLFAILRAVNVSANHTPLLVNGYGFGASFVARNTKPIQPRRSRRTQRNDLFNKVVLGDLCVLGG